MADNTGIEWTNATWPVVQGCDYESPGCTNCYVPRTLWRLSHNPDPKISEPLQGLIEKKKNKLLFTGKVALRHDRLDWPRTLRKARRIFVPSHGDLFHEDVPTAFIDAVFNTMAECPRHTFQLLTKRSARMREYINGLPDRRKDFACHAGLDWCAWPLPNVWLGVSVEDQRRADERIPDLVCTPAARRFLSCEPLLGSVAFSVVTVKAQDVLDNQGKLQDIDGAREIASKGYDVHLYDLGGIDWVICGGESGPGKRPMKLEWARQLRDECHAGGVAFFMKQIDKVQPIPNDLMVREFPDRWAA